MSIIARPSPNFGPRRGGVRPDMVVIHYTAMDTAEAALERLCTTEFEVSAHYLICEQGRVFQMVDEADRAWHAGAGQWGGVCDVNSHSIGVELANTGQGPFEAAQMDALEGLLADILPRWGISPERVIGHADMAPARKVDPGRWFDWRRLAQKGLSVWAENAGDQLPLSEEDQAQFWDDLRRFGYPPTAKALLAFRDRFKTAPHGAPLLTADGAVAAALAKAHPVIDPETLAG